MSTATVHYLTTQADGVRAKASYALRTLPIIHAQREEARVVAQNAGAIARRETNHETVRAEVTHIVISAGPASKAMTCADPACRTIILPEAWATENHMTGEAWCKDCWPTGPKARS